MSRWATLAHAVPVARRARRTQACANGPRSRSRETCPPGKRVAWPAPVSAPRRLVTKQLHAFSRRTRDGELKLIPTPAVNSAAWYVLGVALERAPQVELLTFLVHTNHVHGVAVDGAEASELAVFNREFNSLTARALNSHYGRRENFWAQPRTYHNVEIHDAPGRQDALEEQLLYVWTNLVKDGLVDDPQEWVDVNGLIILPEHFCTEIVVQRPDDAYFGGLRPDDWEPTYPPAREEHRQRRQAAERAQLQQEAERDAERGRTPARSRQLAAERARRRRDCPARRERRTLPDFVTIKIGRPPGYDDLSDVQLRRYFRELLDAKIVELLAERERPAMGIQRVLAQDPFSRAQPLPPSERAPRLAGPGPTGKKKDLKAALHAFQRGYAEAKEAWCAGDRDVWFPPGTYWLHVHHGANVLPNPRDGP